MRAAALLALCILIIPTWGIEAGRVIPPTPPASAPPAFRLGSSQPRTTPMAIEGASVAGTATWYCDPPFSRCTRGYPAGGMFAAAGSEIRMWRGRSVLVTADNGRSVVVRLIDSCACKGNRIIDLYRVAMRQLYGNIGGGHVVVTLAGAAPQQTLPPTDTEAG